MTAPTPANLLTFLPRAPYFADVADLRHDLGLETDREVRQLVAQAKAQFGIRIPESQPKELDRRSCWKVAAEDWSKAQAIAETFYDEHLAVNQ